MPIAKITGQGLLAMACSVALLWGCVIGERVMWRNADSRRVRVFREMEQLQKNPHPAPVSVPMPSPFSRPLVTAG